jgi:DnaJ-domain-containing protein 1
MFERNPVDNASLVTVAVEITLDDGSVVTGRAALPPSRAIHKLLDGTDPFLFVDQFDGDSAFIPKSAIKALKVVTPVKMQTLYLQPGDASTFDPYKTLGLAKGATWDDIRGAYHRLAKLYHPDVYSAVTLPPEVSNYLDGRAKQINTAFRLLKAPRRAAGTAA